MCLAELAVVFQQAKVVCVRVCKSAPLVIPPLKGRRVTLQLGPLHVKLASPQEPQQERVVVTRKQALVVLHEPLAQLQHGRRPLVGRLVELPLGLVCFVFMSQYKR